jgi:predicted dithiol-disulfide oxidoreductase (DUF899 family)
LLQVPRKTIDREVRDDHLIKQGRNRSKELSVPRKADSARTRARQDSPSAGPDSVFCKNENCEVFHTSSCHGRGIDMVNGAYQFLDLVPKGRDEDRFKLPMLWVRRHDQY